MTPHAPRWWEYPWVLREVRRNAPTDGAAADFGAGTSPIPIALTQRGYRTVVVDPDIERLTGRRFGNEWDHADYSRWGIETREAGMEDPVFPSGTLALAVSVSVIEHVTAEVRRTGIRQIWNALATGGALILTVDLEPDGVHLWNRILGQEVESVEQHGTIDDLLLEASDVGFTLLSRCRCPMPTTGEIEGIVFRRTAQ
jgi:SAM-dependent methyltransferase